MIDIRIIREKPELFKTACKTKKFDVDINRLLELDEALKEAKQRLQEVVTEKNRLGKSIPKLVANEKKKAIGQLTKLKTEEAELNESIKNKQPEFDELMLQVPQLPDEDVPVGDDDTQNTEIRREGEIRKFDFEPKDHLQLALALDIVDIERGVKIAGTRNYCLKGDGALLHWAILRFALDYMVQKRYVPMLVPVLAKEQIMQGTGFFPGAEEQTYQMERDELNLVGTAEVPVTAFHSGEILTADELPKKYVALSSCFRREAGAAGKDTYGLFRMHQFDKVEQVIICKNSIEESKKYHAEILGNSENVMKALGLPYRVVNVCTGDLGRGQAHKFDIETWMPSRGGYCETHSASRFYDFQARRLNLRYKDQVTKKNVFCHTLNNTVIASPRILISLLELYQNADGSVTIPEVLRAYMGNKEKIT